MPRDSCSNKAALAVPIVEIWFANKSAICCLFSLGSYPSPASQQLPEHRPPALSRPVPRRFLPSSSSSPDRATVCPETGCAPPPVGDPSPSFLKAAVSSSMRSGTKTHIGQNRSSRLMAQLLMPLPSWNIVSHKGQRSPRSGLSRTLLFSNSDHRVCSEGLTMY